MGVGNEHPYRIEAGILHTLRELEDDGHTRAETDNLIALLHALFRSALQ